MVQGASVTAETAGQEAEAVHGHGACPDCGAKAHGKFCVDCGQQGGRFHTGVMNTDGTGERIISSSYFEEGPSWAPNGRYVMFARQSPGGDTRLWTVDLSGRVVAQAGYTERGSSPAWSGLLDAPPANLGVNQGPDSCAAS